MKTSQALTLTLLFGLAGTAQAEISGSGHQVQGCTGVVRTLVWHDTNGNGVQDAGEAPLADVELQLERVSDPQLGADSLYTDSSGHARFFNLCLRDHMLRVSPASLPPGMVPTMVNIGSHQRDVFDSDGSVTFAPVRIVLDDGHRVEETVDFGFAGPQCDASIGDRVWLDEDANGLQDDYEPGLAGIALRLEDSSGNLAARATSDRHGLYRFGGLCPGAYTVELDAVPSGFVASPAQQGDEPQLDSQASRHNVVVEGRDDSIDFGLARFGCSGTIAGALFDDADLSGTRDEGEHALTGAAVFVDTAGGYRQYALTNQDGRFELRGLCAGSYTVAADATTLPDDALPTTAPGLPYLVELDANDAVVEIDAAGYSTRCGASIGDRVWLDHDGDGIQSAGEVGLADVTIVLRDALGNARGSRVTGSDGKYLFGALCAGEFAVQVDAMSLPAGFLPTLEHAGGQADDSDGTAPVWVTLDTNLSADASVDFGYVPPPTPVLRLDTECHPLTPESQEFDCDKPVSTLSMIWRGRETVRVVAYLGDEEDDVLTERRDVAPGQRVRIDGYEDAPNDVMWRVYNEATGAHMGDSWFHLSCSDKDMDGPEDCGTLQGDGKDGDDCDDECLVAWALDGIIDKQRRLRCTGDEVVPNQQCEAQQQSTVYLQHTLMNLGGSTAQAVAVDSDFDASLAGDHALVLESGASVTFGGLADVDASTEWTVSATCVGGEGSCDASRSTSVSATPIPDCSVFGLSRLKKDDDKIKWHLTNAGQRDVTIDRVDVSWPNAHGKLKEVKRGGDKIVDYETPAHTASFDAAAMVGERHKRQLERGKSEEMEFKFKRKSKDRRDDDYAITVHFEEGCSVTLTP